MKKKSLVLVAGLLALVALASCSKESGPDMPIVGENNGISFSSNITNRNPGSRASGGTWENADSIGVYMFEWAETTLAKSKKNVKYIASVGGAEANFNPALEDSEIFFPDDDTYVVFMAYYPYRKDIVGDYSNGNIYKVNVSNQEKQSAIDLLYSFNKETKYNKYSKVGEGKIPLEFTHMLSQIKISLTAGTGFNDLEGVTVSLEGMNTTADFYLFKGELKELKEEVVIIPLLSTNNSYEAIVLPDNTSGKAKIKITLERKDGEENYTDRFFWTFDHDLVASNSYTYNVTVNRTGLVVEGSITNWLPGGEKSVSAE